MKIKLPAILLSFFAFSNVHAIDYSYSIFSTLSQSDNLAQSDVPISGESLNAGVNFNVNSDTNSAIQLALNGSLSREYYSISELDPQDNDNVSGSLLYKAPKINFQFLVRDDLSQTPRNRFSSQSVNNLAKVNVVTLRPTYSLRLSSVQQVIFDYTHVETNNESQNDPLQSTQLFDSSTATGTISFLRRLNATNDASLVVSEINTEYGETSNPNVVDYKQTDVLLRWVGRGRYNQMQVELGQSEIVDALDRTFNDDLATVIYSRQINRNETLELNYRKGFFINLSQNFTNNTIDVDNQSSNFGNAQRFVNKSLTYNKTGGIFNTRLEFYDQQFHSTLVDNSESRQGASLSFVYSVQRLFATSYESNVSLSLRHSKNGFTNLLGEFKTEVNGIEARYTYAYSAKLALFAALTKREASDDIVPNASALNRDANIISIGFTYTPTIDPSVTTN